MDANVDDGRGIDATLGERRLQIGNRVFVARGCLDIPTGAGSVTQERALEVEIDGGDQHQRENDQAEHGDGHAGAAAGRARIGDAQLERGAPRAEDRAKPRHQPEQRAIVLHDDQRGRDDEEDAGDEEHLEVAFVLAEDAGELIVRQQPEDEQQHPGAGEGDTAGKANLPQDQRDGEDQQADSGGERHSRPGRDALHGQQHATSQQQSLPEEGFPRTPPMRGIGQVTHSRDDVEPADPP